MIYAPLLLLKTIFKHNSMHLMLQVHRTEKKRQWSASDNRFQFRRYRIVLNFLLTDEHLPLEIMKSSPPPMLDSQCGPHVLTNLCYNHFIIVDNRIYHLGVYS